MLCSMYQLPKPSVCRDTPILTIILGVGYVSMFDVHSFTSNYRFVGKLSRMGAEKYLEGMKNGTFLVRESDGQQGYTHAIAIR